MTDPNQIVLPRFMVCVLVLGLAVSGCRTSHRIGVSELYKLDGFEEGDRIPLWSRESDEVTFTSNTTLTLFLRDGRSFSERYGAIQFDGVMFRGEVYGESVTVPALDIAYGEVAYWGPHSGMKALLIIAGVAVVVYVAWYAFVYHRAQQSGGGGH